MRRIRRKLFCLISPRQYTLVKLLLVILFSTVWFLNSKQLQLQSTLNSVAVSKKNFEKVTPSVEKVSKIVEKEVRTMTPLSISSSSLQEYKTIHLSLPISTMSKAVIVIAATTFTDEMEKSRSRLHISQSR